MTDSQPDSRMHPSDEDLVSAYIEQGDERAFRLLVERHQERVYGYLIGMVRDADAANDLFQDTFIRVINALNSRRGSYTQQGRFLAWLVRIARNAALDHLRSRRRWVDGESQTPEQGAMLDNLADNAPMPDHQLFDAEQRQWLEECIDALPSEQREVLLMRHDSELTFREIAEVTGCSINTALGRMRYALINLRRIMADSKKKSLIEA